VGTSGHNVSYTVFWLYSPMALLLSRRTPCAFFDFSRPI